MVILAFLGRSVKVKPTPDGLEGVLSSGDPAVIKVEFASSWHDSLKLCR